MFLHLSVSHSVHRGVCIQGWVGIQGGSVSRSGSASGGGTDPLRYYGIRSTSGRYASYWNAFLFTFAPILPLTSQLSCMAVELMTLGCLMCTTCPESLEVTTCRSNCCSVGRTPDPPATKVKQYAKSIVIYLSSIVLKPTTVADPGFARRGPTPNVGAPTYWFWPISHENCIKMKKIGRGGGGKRPWCPHPWIRQWRLNVFKWCSYFRMTNVILSNHWSSQKIPQSRK